MSTLGLILLILVIVFLFGGSGDVSPFLTMDDVANGDRRNAEGCGKLSMAGEAGGVTTPDFANEFVSEFGLRDSTISSGNAACSDSIRGVFGVSTEVEMLHVYAAAAGDVARRVMLFAAMQDEHTIWDETMDKFPRHSVRRDLLVFVLDRPIAVRFAPSIPEQTFRRSCRLWAATKFLRERNKLRQMAAVVGAKFTTAVLGCAWVDFKLNPALFAGAGDFRRLGPSHDVPSNPGCLWSGRRV